MKKSLLLRKAQWLCLLLFGFLSHAQTVNTDYATQINAVFANLDKSKIPNKLLVDYAMEFEELSNFNGSISANNIVTAGTYTNIYNTLLMSRVQSGVPGLVSPQNFKTNWKNLRQPHTIVLSGLYYKYSEFKPDAPNNTITVNNGKLYDRYENGVWQNPYDEKQVFAVSSPINKFNYLEMDVQIPSALWYTNQGSIVQSMAVDFGDGNGYQNLAFDSTVSLSYSQPGLHEWKYRLTLTDGQILYSHSKIQIDGEAPVIAAKAIPGGPGCILNTQGVQEINFNGLKAYLGSANQAILEIDYAANDCVIRKPLIVVEGFDSGLLGVENPLGEVSYTNFKRSITNSFSTNLPSQLYTYDIIYVNFKNGNDYMQRNAYLIEDIIKWANQKKTSAGSTEKTVVLGQSMGGVIARYALRDMEVTNQNHDTSLFISHDAPHQGANLPLSIQYFARHMADQFVNTPLGDFNINITGDGGSVTIEDLRDLLNAPGTKQLLSNYISQSFSLDNSFSNTWQTELRNLGYPLQTRNIALSNASHCAFPQSFNPSDNLFSISGIVQTKLLTDLIISFVPGASLISSTVLAVMFNEPGLLIGILPGNSKFDIEFYGKALPTAGTTSQIYKGRIAFTKTLFKLFGWTPRITVTLTNRNYNSPGGLSYDYYPGGKYRTFFTGDSNSASNILIAYNIQFQAIDSFDFIPTPSALDIGNGNTPLGNEDYFAKYNSVTPPVFPKSSPFVNFTTSYNTNGLNENHISFNTRNGNWLATELDSNASNNQVFSCTYICTDTKIEGSSNLCSTSVYSLPEGAGIYNWSITGGNNISIQNNGSNTITLSNTGTYNGVIILTASIGENAKCGTKTLTKTIWIGAPIISITPNESTTNYVTVSAASGSSNASLEDMGLSPTNVVWKRLDNGQTRTGYTYSAHAPGYNWSFDVEVKATNSCGTFTTYAQITPRLPEDCSTFSLAETTAAPNNYIILKSVPPDCPIDPNNPNKQGDQYQITVANSMGTTVISKTGDTFDLSPFPIGMYVVNIQKDNQVIINQTIIKN